MTSFYAFLSRMKLIRRWSLMRTVQPENVQEHSHQVAVIAHALAEIDNRLFGGHVDPGQIVLLALYHDVGEVVVGDLPTPVKYFNNEIHRSFAGIEDIACEQLLTLLPEDLRAPYRPLFFPDPTSREYRLMKAADKLCAYIKCLEELTAGNGEFQKAANSNRRDLLQKYQDEPAVVWFIDHCLPAFSSTLDELG